MFNLLRICLLLAITSVAISQEPATQWLEWRGGSAQGTSKTTKLPTNLDPEGATLQWRAPVRGRGISSPIVVDDRVFVTTAHRYEGGLLPLRSGAIASLSALSLLAAAMLVVSRLARMRRGTGATSTRGRWLLRCDWLMVMLMTGCFLWFAVAAHFAPDSLWTLGRPGEAWLMTGAIVLSGLAAASGWAYSGTRLRCIMTMAVIAVSFLLWHGVPYDRYGIQHGAGPRALMLTPGLAFACWSLATWWPGRNARAHGTDSSKPLTVIGGVSVAATALVLFVSVNLTSGDRLARSLVCYDLQTGDQLWERVLLVAPREPKWPTNSYATPTPCSDGKRVFAYFGAGWSCVDLDGHVLWNGTDPHYVAASRYGAGASPIFDGDQILLWQENEAVNRASYIQAFDALTGATNWRVEPGDLHDSYSTPILVPRKDGEYELVSMSYKKLVSHSPSDGSRLWELPLPSRQPIPSLCYAGDDLLLVSGGTHLGFSTSGVRLRGAGKDTSHEVIWQTRRNLSEICSPVLGNGLFFTVIDGRMRCIEPETGKIHWTGRLGTGDYWASLVAGDNKVYALSGDGDLTTVAMDASEFRVLSQSSLNEDCMATPAIATGRVIVRTETALLCFGAAPDPGE